MPFVSLLVDSAHCPDKSLETIHSLQQQSYPHREILECNTVSSALAQAQGEYYSVIEGGALWNPELLSEALPALQASGASVALMNWQLSGTSGQVALSSFQRLYNWQSFPPLGWGDWREMRLLEARAMYVDSNLAPISALVFRRPATAIPWRQQLGPWAGWCFVLEHLLYQNGGLIFSMKASWLNRMETPRVQPPGALLKVLRRAVQDRLRPREYAQLTALIGEESLLALEQSVRERNLVRAVGNLSHLSLASLQGLAHCPSTFLRRLQRNSSWARIIRKLSGRPA